MSDFLEGKTLEELQPLNNSTSVSNLIEPTDAEKLEVVELLRQGMSYGEVKKTWERVEGNSHLSLSTDQIKAIDLAYKNKLAELQSE